MTTKQTFFYVRFLGTFLMNKLFSRLTMAFLLSASCFLVSGCTNDEPAGGGDSAASSSSESGSSADEHMEKAAGGSDSKPAGGGSGSK